MFRSSLLLSAVFLIMVFSCSKSGSDDSGDTGGTGNPAPGSTRMVTVDYTYDGAQIGASSFAAFPLAVFPADQKAVKYKARLFNFSGTAASPPEGKTIEWKAGDLPPTDYHFYPDTKDVHDGSCYLTLGRTWCSGGINGCNMSSTETWIANYKKLYGSPKVEITYFY